MPETSDQIEERALASALESVLLVASEAVSVRTLAHLLGTDSKHIQRAVDFLVADHVGCGTRLQSHGGKLQLVTAPENAEFVRRFLRLPRQPRISKASLETLAIISYRQPATRSEIEEIRGVGVDRVIANLLARDLIEETGRRETPGRPIEYGTTSSFLELFGLGSLDDLPFLEVSSQGAQHSLRVLGMNEMLSDNP